MSSTIFYYLDPLIPKSPQAFLSFAENSTKYILDIIG